jgi:2-polyprenyl-3-methyl-5-hydroxy-6-metoxy-1,4-benzoquinol methylase
MDTDYDRIATKYKRAKLQPWRAHIEQYTLLRLVGDLTGKSVIDLACGEGYYTRLLRQAGAARVVGVDLSHEMIGLADAQEALDPLGIEYRVSDVKALDAAGEFDVAVAAYLLNYAQTAEELTAMCRAVAGVLKPGGRFVTVNSSPTDPPENFDAGRPYGFTKRLIGEFVEGAPIVWQFFLPSGTLEITNYQLSVSTMEEAFRAAGLHDVRWHAPEVSPEGEAEFGHEHWAAFLRQPPVTFITCVR